MSLPEPLEVALAAVQIFDALNIPYVIGGSLASSMQGIPRATQDIDMVADIGAGQVPDLVKMFARDWHIDENVVREAVRQRSSFNIIHLETMYKIDVFILKNDPFHIAEMKRRETLDMESGHGGRIHVASAEDIVLQKLLWYAAGGKVSERQLNDVRGVLKIQKGNLDITYLKNTAGEIGVSGLLSDLLDETGQ
jgi:hypothetical protein